METPLHGFLKARLKLPEESINDIVSNFKLMKPKRNEILEKAGKICNRFYFVNKGCLRVYGFDKKGNEITAYFALEDSFVSLATSFLTLKPALDYLIALEPSEVMVISRERYFGLTNKYAEFDKLNNLIIQAGFIHAQMRIYGFLGMEGIDKLKWVMEHEPKLLTRIASKQVAAYLGMTNSTLSKLKTKL